MHRSNNKKVIAALIIKDNKILIAQRGKRDELYGKWEFPGGKQEEGETAEECLQRELFEEFGIQATVGSYFTSSYFFHKEQSMELMAFYVNSFSDEFILYEHKQIKWVSKNELELYDFPEPDKPIIQKVLNQ